MYVSIKVNMLYGIMSTSINIFFDKNMITKIFVPFSFPFSI